MSIRHMNRVLDLRLSPVPKLVLLIFADCANDTGICWPGIQHVATRASVSKRTVQRLIPTFEELGLLLKKPRYGKSGRQLSSEYQIFPISMDSDKLSPTGDSTGTSAVTLVNAEDVTHVTQTTTTETINHLMNHHDMAISLTIPTTLKPTEQNAAIKLLSHLPLEDAQTLLDELSGRLRQGHIRSPISYLRMLVTRLEQGAFIPELSHAIAAQRAQQKAAIKTTSAKILAPEARAEALKQISKMKQTIRNGDIN